MSTDSELDEYWRFTGPQRLEKSINTLRGVLQGIAADDVVRPAEVGLLQAWVRTHRPYANRHPFSEVFPALEAILEDGKVDPEEFADIVWVTERLEGGNAYWDEITGDMQELQGFLRGIIADGLIKKSELDELSKWIDERQHLRRCWPYDELESIITSVLADGVIDDQEHAALMDFFGEFTGQEGRRAVGALDRNTSVSGVCVLDPEIDFRSRLFCFTGRSKRAQRHELAARVEKLGGRFNAGLRKDTDFLVVGADGNPCWAYACYGRKIEDAIERRRGGQRLLIVHEYDFWDAVEVAESA